MSKPIKKQRVVNNFTRLVICEGISDKKLMEKIKSIFLDRKGNLKVQIDEAGGGGPKGALNRAINFQGDFDEKYLFIDSDIPLTEEVLKVAKRRDIEIIQSVPVCLEGMLLKIKGFPKQINDAEQAKQEMQKTFGLQLVVTESWYNDHITREVCESIIADEKHCAK